MLPLYLSFSCYNFFYVLYVRSHVTIDLTGNVITMIVDTIIDV
jgi:hypothetical protein